jgi:hypothetical protein
MVGFSWLISISLFDSSSPEFTKAEYEEHLAETRAQLQEFQLFLDKAMTGNMTLVDEFNSAQLVCLICRSFPSVL